MLKKTGFKTLILSIILTAWAITAYCDDWPMRQRDMHNTGRADYTVPEDRLNNTFFDDFLWQTPVPGPGNLSSTSMSFFGGAGPEGTDIVVGTYHWPKGIQGMDRHTGKKFWSGNPEGGEMIGTMTPAFSPDGSTIYIVNDSTGDPPNPLMAFSSQTGPSTFWHNGADADPNQLRNFSPTIAADGRIFLHKSGDRPYGGTDNGSAITQTWAAQNGLNEGACDPALYQDTDHLKVVAAGLGRTIKAFTATEDEPENELWSVNIGQVMEASVTINPVNGNIYVSAGNEDIYIVGLDKDGAPLWTSPSLLVYDYIDGSNNPQRAQSAGCLSHDGSTYYFQTISAQGDGRLYAVNTMDGSLKWTYDTLSEGWETWNQFYASPIITKNNVIIIGNNDGNTYFALKDETNHAALLDTFTVDPEGKARVSATLSDDGNLYLPLRTQWVAGNGDGDVPTLAVTNLFCALDIRKTSGDGNWPMRQKDMHNTGRADYSIPENRLNETFFDVFLWQKPVPAPGKLSSTSMTFFDGAGPEGVDLIVGTYHWPKGVQGMDRHTGKKFWSGNPEGGEMIGTMTPAFSPDGSTIYVVNDSTGDPPNPLMAFSSQTGPSTFWHNGADADPNQLRNFSPTIAGDGRIFLHKSGDRPYGGTDNGSAITQTWAAQTALNEGASDPALYQDSYQLKVVAAGQSSTINAYDGNPDETENELWSVYIGAPIEASVTIDPANGNIYAGAGNNDIYIAGLDKEGNPLWTAPSLMLYDYAEGVNNPQRAQSAGCLSHEGSTYYFQTISAQGDGRLYAVNTSDGSLKWTYDTQSEGWETWHQFYASPIITKNNVIIIGNNDGDTYFALKDESTHAALLDAFTVNPEGKARASATLSDDGKLYLPLRTQWSVSNGDGDAPSFEVINLFAAVDMTEDAVAIIYPPHSVSATALNNLVEISWAPVIDTSGQFLHYAVYRSGSQISSVEGLTAIGTVDDINTTYFSDETAANGTAYYYAVTVVTSLDSEITDVTGIGPRTPWDETDLQVISMARTPRFPRYNPLYTYYDITEPSGFGPYTFSAATGLGSGQTPETPRWPEIDDPVTYTATIRNRGTNAWTGDLQVTWKVDDLVAAQDTKTISLAPGQTTSYAHVLNWDGNSHKVEIRLDLADERSTNNDLAIDTRSVPILLYVDKSYIQDFREIDTPLYPDAVTDDFLDWVNYNMARLNTMFENAGSQKRVHYDLLEVIEDTDPDPETDRQPFAVFPFRFYAQGASYRSSGYYRAAQDIDYGFLHEMGHQLGLIDLYQLDVPSQKNDISGSGYSGPEGLMHSCADFISPHSALGMEHWIDQVHGYFGQYMYNIPAQIVLRILDIYGQPLEEATVKMYQYCERPGQGKVITDQIKAQGTTDANGEFLLPNVALDSEKVPPSYTGDELHDNPFGYLAVVGTNGVLHFRVEYEGGVDYCWLDVTEANVAYFNGQTDAAVFERQLGLGGLAQYCPPREITEMNAADWSAWAEGSSAQNTYVENDTERKLSGSASLKFVTDGGSDTYVRYPRTFVAHWDLENSDVMNISFYAENPSPYGFQNHSPWIRLKDADNNYFEYQYYKNGSKWDILNEARDNWKSCVIPLDASEYEENGWRRTVFGTPDLAHIQYIEIHADTWGSGFTLWIDDLGFDPSPLCPCIYDSDEDADVDGKDLSIFIYKLGSSQADISQLETFSKNFGKTDCQ